jgi:hypothetical protein
MHLLSLPLPFPGSLKYRPAVPRQDSIKLKGISWFVEVSQVSPYARMLVEHYKQQRINSDGLLCN